jgi:hypothetical protein
MTSTIRRWKRGSTVPAIADRLLDAVGNPINLTGATVMFMFGSVSAGSASVHGTAQITVATTGDVAWAWGTGDLAVPGLYYAGWQIRYQAGGTETLPQGGTIPGEPDWRLVRVTP